MPDRMVLYFIANDNDTHKFRGCPDRVAHHEEEGMFEGTWTMPAVQPGRSLRLAGPRKLPDVQPWNHEQPVIREASMSLDPLENRVTAGAHGDVIARAVLVILRTISGNPVDGTPQPWRIANSAGALSDGDLLHALTAMPKPVVCEVIRSEGGRDQVRSSRRKPAMGMVGGGSPGRRPGVQSE
jgi:hypothetical protein